MKEAEDLPYDDDDDENTATSFKQWDTARRLADTVRNGVSGENSRDADALCFEAEHKNKELAAYLTGEYASASCIPRAELAQKMLRHKLLFQSVSDDETGLDAIERGRVAVRTVLTHALHPHRLSHATVTGYELFRAFSSGSRAGSPERALLEVDLLIVRLNGDDRRYRWNGDRIDYTYDLESPIICRLHWLNRPTWVIATRNHRSDAFQAAYGGGLLNLTRMFDQNSVEVHFGDSEQARIRTRQPWRLTLDPNTGKGRITRCALQLLRDWYSEILQEERSRDSRLADEPFAVMGRPDIDPGSSDYNTQAYDTWKRAECAREHEKAKQAANLGANSRQEKYRDDPAEAGRPTTRLVSVLRRSAERSR